MRLGRAFVSLLGVLLATNLNCYEGVPIGCQVDADCEVLAAGGQCEVTQFCSVPDIACPTGRRWHAFSGSLAHDCVAPSYIAPATLRQSGSTGPGDDGWDNNDGSNHDEAFGDDGWDNEALLPPSASETTETTG